MQEKTQNISSIKQRILYFAGTLGISKREFYTKTGISRGTLESKTGITEDVLAKFFATYPIVSVEWIMTGAGKMLKAKDFSKSTTSGVDFQVNSQNTQTEELPFETRPRIPFDASAGVLSIATQGVTFHECEQVPVIPTLPRYDFSIVARGDSMYPEFHSGDELACALIKEAAFIQWGRPHVLDTAQGIVVKRIFDKGENIECRSVNPDYPPFVIPKDEIYRLAIVVGFIRQL